MGWLGGGPAGGTFAAEERRRLIKGCGKDDGGPTDDDDESPPPACVGSGPSRIRCILDNGLDAHSSSIFPIAGRSRWRENVAQLPSQGRYAPSVLPWVKEKQRPTENVEEIFY